MSYSDIQHDSMFLLKLLGVAALYALIAKFALSFFSANGVISIIWPSSGFALATLLIGGKKYYPGVFLGAFLANVMTGLALSVAAAIAIGNTIEALLGAWLITRGSKFYSNLSRLRDYMLLVALGGFLACGIAALNGSTTLLVSGFITTGGYFKSISHWWMGDVLGIVIITPLILVWRRMPDGWFKSKRVAEIAFVLGLVFLSNQIVFFEWFHGPEGVFEQIARGYWMFLFIMIVAMRLQTHGVTLALAMTAVQALIGSAQGVGFFAHDIEKTQLTTFWFYMMTVSVVGMALATHFAERKKSEEDIKELAFYDPLTHLPNRRLLLDRFKQALASSARTRLEGALLFIDLDNFKNINDTLGHKVGDLLLQQVAQRIESCVREGDTVSRLGGDEFVVMLEHLSGHDIEAAAQTKIAGEKILTTLRQPYQIDKFEYHCTTSIGATIFNKSEQDIDELLKQADIAMYQAKKEGRNTLRFFNPAMQAAISTRVALESDLRRAIALQREFQLYYQAQVDSSGCLVGAEALIRWLHPERGMVSPAEFIPFAEETGLILPLGHWVLVTACQQLAAWAAQPKTAHITLSVNISAKQFQLPTFVDEVLTLVDYFKVAPSKLKLEITESLMLDDIDVVIDKMVALKNRGINFSMDDFGTGYSSLQYLKRLPLDQIKIDQSFVRGISVENSDKAIVRTIIAMAQSLSVSTIAEGVETEEQRQILLNKGCTIFQGYLFGKPIPIEQFDALLYPLATTGSIA